MDKENKNIDWIEAIKKRVRNDFDIVICVTGEEGIGKSTLAMQMGFLLDDKFDIKKNVCFVPTPENVKKQFGEIDRYGCLVIDEGTEVFYKLDWMTSFQKTLVKMFKRERKQNKIVIICLPAFMDLTKSMRNDRVKLWFHVFKRGLAGIFTKHPSQLFSDDPWMLSDNAKTFQKVFGRRKAPDVDPNDLLTAASRLKTFWMDFEFRNLKKKNHDIYAEQSRIQRDAFYADEEKRKANHTAADVRRNVARKLHSKGFTGIEIAEILSVSQGLVSGYINDHDQSISER